MPIVLVRSSLIRMVVALGMAVLLSLNFMFAHLEHRTHEALKRAHTSERARLKLPSANVLRVAFGGFETMAADIVWIWSLIYYSQQHDRASGAPYLENYADTIVELDPRFYPIYRWFSTTYIDTHYPISHEDLTRVSDFLERGMQYFPNDYRLLKTAGLNYIGHSSDRSPEVRLDEIERAIRYLQRASQYPEAPERLAFTVAWLYQRKRQLEREIRGDDETSETSRGGQVEFFMNMYYLVDSADARKRIRERLRRLGKEQLLVERAERYRDRLKRTRRRQFSYVPLGLWTALIAPDR